MWKLLRRQQGLASTAEEHAAQDEVLVTDVPVSDEAETQPGYVPPTTSAQAARMTRFEINSRSIALHSWSDQAPEAPADALTAPYGNWVYGKILRYAEHENLVLRVKALVMLLELYAQKVEHVLQSLKEGALPMLIGRLEDPEEDVRRLSATALQEAVKVPLGQELVLQGNYLPNLLAVLDDPSPATVAEGLRVCHGCHAMRDEARLTKALIKLQCIPKYVEKIASPDDDVCAAALAALSRVFDCKEAFIAVNDERSIGPITRCLERADVGVVVEACELVSRIAVYLAGKRAASNCQTVRALLPLVVHEEVEVRTAATGAVVALTIIEDGKRDAIAAGAVRLLVDLFETESERDVLVNAVKTVCNLSEHPEARADLRALVPRFEVLLKSEGLDESLEKSLRRAIAMVRWKPGDSY